MTLQVLNGISIDFSYTGDCKKFSMLIMVYLKKKKKNERKKKKLISFN